MLTESQHQAVSSRFRSLLHSPAFLENRISTVYYFFLMMQMVMMVEITHTSGLKHSKYSLHGSIFLYDTFESLKYLDGKTIAGEMHC